VFDAVTSDVTVEHSPFSRTQTLTTRSADLTLQWAQRIETDAVTLADGSTRSTRTTLTDENGNGTYDSRTDEVITQSVTSGSVTEQSSYRGKAGTALDLGSAATLIGRAFATHNRPMAELNDYQPYAQAA
jgi:Tfp pilus assembly protein FimT